MGFPGWQEEGVEALKQQDGTPPKMGPAEDAGSVLL